VTFLGYRVSTYTSYGAGRKSGRKGPAGRTWRVMRRPTTGNVSLRVPRKEVTKFCKRHGYSDLAKKTSRPREHVDSQYAAGAMLAGAPCAVLVSTLMPTVVGAPRLRQGPSKRDRVVDRTANGLQDDGRATELFAAGEFIEIAWTIGGSR
jgi:hypothetical protein